MRGISFRYILHIFVLFQKCIIQSEGYVTALCIFRKWHFSFIKSAILRQNCFTGKLLFQLNSSIFRLDLTKIASDRFIRFLNTGNLVLKFRFCYYVCILNIF